MGNYLVYYYAPDKSRITVAIFNEYLLMLKLLPEIIAYTDLTVYVAGISGTGESAIGKLPKTAEYLATRYHR